MSSDAVPVLPSEVLSDTLAYLSLRDLTSASIVCQRWQALVFPLLYHTVYLAVPSRRLELLRKQIAADNNGALSVRAHLRGLVLDQKYDGLGDGDYSTEGNLEHLTAILPNLSRLEHFSWELGFIPHDLSVIESLRTGCPNLNSIHFTVEEQADTLEFYDDAYKQIFNFENLSHFSLTVRYLPCEYDEHHLDPLVSLLRASPNIQSLTLNLLDYSSTGLTWSPTALVAALDNPTFPSLHTFRALGESYPDWSSFFDAPESDPLRAFFSRHPGLRTVGLGWVAETAHWRPIDKHDLAALFPSLVHLAAPAYLCGPLMASKLADQLESVAVLDDWYDSTGPDTIAEGIQGMKLSKLQKLAFHVEKEDSIEVEALKVVIGAAPGLEELEFRIPLDEPDELLELLKLAPNLRVLGVLPTALSSLGSSALEVCIPLLAQACPRLEFFNNLDAGDEREIAWTVQRRQDGEITASMAR